MSRVPDEKEVPEAHRLGDKAAQRRDALVDRGALGEPIGVFRRQPRPQFGPEALIRPAFDALIARTLQIVAVAGLRSHAAQREAVCMTRVDQLVIHRRHIGKDTKPAKRIRALDLRDATRGGRWLE